jgi:hypothetical protein
MFKLKFIAGGVLAVLLGAGPTVVTFRMITGAPRNVLDYGAVSDGTDTHVAIQAALNAGAGVVWMPPSPTCYNIGTTSLTIATGRTLVGGGLGQAQGATCVVYSGTGYAIVLNDTQTSALRDFDLTVNSASATAGGIDMAGTTLTNEFNEISGVSVRQTNATRRVAGQIGLRMRDNGQGVYWNSFKRLRFAFWDNSIKLVGGINGVNANRFEDIMSWGHATAFHTITTQVTNNSVLGLHCSRSDGTFVGTANCVVLGDDGSGSSFNKLYFTSDQGAPSVCFTAGAGAGGNIVDADCQSGGAAFTGDTNVSAFPNYIYDTINAAAPSLLHLGRLAMKAEISSGTVPATAGDIRMSNAQSLAFRDQANTANITGVTVDSNNRAKYGTGGAFLRLDNNIVEHGTGTVGSTGNERFVSNWTSFARNAANNANIAIGDFGNTTADVYTLGATVALPPVAFAGLGTPANFAIRGCTDCTIANPCAGGGTGAMAKRLNGVWVCN